jgi:hypothetical protein
VFGTDVRGTTSAGSQPELSLLFVDGSERSARVPSYPE